MTNTLENPSERSGQQPQAAGPVTVPAAQEASCATAPQTAPQPDPYATVTLPENSALTAETLAALKQAAAEINLPAAALSQWVSLEEARLARAAQHQNQAHQTQLETWARQTQDELGENWQAEVSKAVRAADMFGGPELRQLLEETGLGNHPVIVRTFHAVAQCMSEDITPGGVPSAQTDKTFTQALYGKN